MKWTHLADEQMEHESMAVEIPSSLYSWSSSVVAVKIPPPSIEPEPIQHSSSITRTTEYDSYIEDESLTLPYDWLNLNTSVTNFSMESISMSSESEEDADALSDDNDGPFEVNAPSVP